MVQLIVNQLERTKKFSYLMEWTNIQATVRNWNESEKAELHGHMHVETTDTHKIVFMLFDTEEQAALFKLTHL